LGLLWTANKPEGARFAGQCANSLVVAKPDRIYLAVKRRPLKESAGARFSLPGLRRSNRSGSARGEAVAGEALSAYQHAIQLAHEQSALAWELRAATSLALFYRSRDPEKANSVLLPVYQRYTEGHGTTDLVAARRLLDDLTSEQVGRNAG
jgi:predicted ATPase